MRGSREESRLRTVPVDDRCNTFVYNLHTERTAPEVEACIEEVMDDVDIMVIKLELKRTNSSAFVVNCNKRHSDCLLDAGQSLPPRNSETAT